MNQKYIYSFNGIFNWLRGFNIPIDYASKPINPFLHPGSTFIWRNNALQDYKIGDAYLDKPLELSNYLVVRSRERLLLESKVRSPSLVFGKRRNPYLSTLNE